MLYHAILGFELLDIMHVKDWRQVSQSGPPVFNLIAIIGCWRDASRIHPAKGYRTQPHSIISFLAYHFLFSNVNGQSSYLLLAFLILLL